MTIAFWVLVVAVIGALIYIRCVDNAVNAILDQLAATALNEKDFRGGMKREMTKLHSFNKDNHSEISELKKKIAELEKNQEEFSQLADESVRAQIESEKAWAEGVRAIAGFGANIPTLNTKGIEHE